MFSKIQTWAEYFNLPEDDQDAVEARQLELIKKYFFSNEGLPDALLNDKENCLENIQAYTDFFMITTEEIDEIFAVTALITATIFSEESIFEGLLASAVSKESYLGWVSKHQLSIFLLALGVRLHGVLNERLPNLDFLKGDSNE